MVALGAAIDENEGVPRSLANNLTLALNQNIDSNDLSYSELEQLLIHTGLQDIAPNVWGDLGDAPAQVARRSL